MYFQMYEAAKETWHSVKADLGGWKAGEWHHVAAYWDAEFQVMRICLDGHLAATGMLGFEPKFGSVTVWVGADSQLRHGLNGAVDEVVIMNTNEVGGALAGLAAATSAAQPEG